MFLGVISRYLRQSMGFLFLKYMLKTFDVFLIEYCGLDFSFDKNVQNKNFQN